MVGFMIRFLIENVLISGIIIILLIIKRTLKNILTSRLQYNLWFLLLALLSIPFYPFRLIGLPQIFIWLDKLKYIPESTTESIAKRLININTSVTSNQISDFALSVSKETPSIVGLIICGIWVFGIMIMTVLMIKSWYRLNIIKKSALPLQSEEVQRLYRRCLNEMKVKSIIPIYSTAFLKSPVITGLFRPCIYLPIHLISDYHDTDMRYMLLHELQHYKHKDILSDYLINLVRIVYWFNPFVRYALKEMHIEQEVACDASVLMMLDQDHYKEYGNTLINFAEKVSLTPFPFASGLGGSIKQMKRRITNIATFEKPTCRKSLHGITIFALISVLLLGLAPTLSTYAAADDNYHWKPASENIYVLDLSAYFKDFKGSFVLYDLENDLWNIYDMERATLRVSPDSTYKIYGALSGLEEGVITPDSSLIAWDHEEYPFETWNTDQTLQSAMSNSVNWYFQALDQQLGISALNSYMRRIGYGNEMISGDLSFYWLESSLKISPIEQVELLTKLYNNSFDFDLENVNAVKDAICLSSSENELFYGKTGTGRIDGQDINGWFIGFIETADNTYFFATNISADANATGSNATKITMSILSDMNIWK